MLLKDPPVFSMALPRELVFPSYKVNLNGSLADGPEFRFMHQPNGTDGQGRGFQTKAQASPGNYGQIFSVSLRESSFPMTMTEF